MRLLLLFITTLIITACNNNNKSAGQILIDPKKKTTASTYADTTKLNDNIWVDKLTGNKHSLPDTIANKPISFYLENSKVSSIAKAFYSGRFRPEDNDSTTQLLALVTTDDKEIRPFYRWCLDLTINISDGALAEYPGGPALKYAIKFPKEFFDYMDKDSTRERYRQWTEIIAYSGLNDYSRKDSEIENEIISKMHNNCYFCKTDFTAANKSIANSGAGRWSNRLQFACQLWFWRKELF